MPNGHYQLGALLGQGGMGQVHVARHCSGRVVAVKRVRNTLSSDQLMADRLTDEARLLRTVSHPNVVRALDHGTGHDGLPFLVMDRAHGTPLSDLIADQGPLPLERLVAIASQLFAGLTAIHDAQIVHADLKSHNVLVDEVDIVTIIDFGLARTVTASQDTVGLVAGTPAYMAPELIAGAYPSIAGDVYAAATIIYEMLTGSTPFSGQISTILTRQLSEPVEPPSRRAAGRCISPAIDRVLLRALDASPGARFSSVAAFAAAFDAALAGRLETSLATGDDGWLDRPTRRRPGSQPSPGPAAARPSQPPTERLGGPLVRPLGHAFDHPLGGPLEHPLDHPLGHPLGGPLDRPLDRRLDHPLDRRLDHPLDRPLDRRLDRPLDRPLVAPIAGSAPQGLSGLAEDLGLSARPRQDGPPTPADAIISTALAKAQRLIDGRRMTEAVQTLEAALAALMPVLEADAHSATDAWRIETVLAALYDTTGRQERARRMALLAYRHALRSGCALAETRARDLVDRLVTRSRRVARGSTGGTGR